MKKLKTLNKEEANKLYEQYVVDNNNILGEISEVKYSFSILFKAFGDFLV